MPSKSPAQHRLMEGIKHGWKPSGMKHPPSVKVATEFANADEEQGKYKQALADAMSARKRRG